jgi:hypothetical protein
MKTLLAFFLFCLPVFLLISSCSKNDDNTLTPSGNSAPYSPSSPIPVNNSIGLSGAVTVYWTCSDPDAGDTIRYDVVSGFTSNPTTVVASNTLNRAADIGVGPPSTAIYWKVTAKDNHGHVSVSPVWKYTTAP